MAELTISADEIQGAIEEYVAGFEADTSARKSAPSSTPATASRTSKDSRR